MFKQNSSYFSLHPLPFVLSLGTTTEDSGSVFSTALIRYLYTLTRSARHFSPPA